MQPWARLIYRQVGPQRVDCLLAVELAPGGKGQKLDQSSRLPPAPSRGRHNLTAEAHLEPTKEHDLDTHTRTPMIPCWSGIRHPV